MKTHTLEMLSGAANAGSSRLVRDLPVSRSLVDPQRRRRPLRRAHSGSSFLPGAGGARRALLPLALIALCATAAAGAEVSQQTFPSAAEASKSLFHAVRSNDGELIVKILGGPTELASSGDKNQDKLDRERFAQKYEQMHRMVREEDGKVLLYIGAENWPFPIPLVEKNGVWSFDAEAGMQEVLYRRIGENELTAIATCHEFADQNREPAKSGATMQAAVLPASLVTKAGGSTAADPVLFHGYYFRVLASPTGKKGGGLAMVAYPAEYRSSGVMTFIVAANDVVYEKDLGDTTPGVAGAMKTFHKDSTWRTAR